MIREFREYINIRLYNNKKPVLRFMRVSSFLLALLAIFLLAYYNGFPQTEQSNNIIVNSIRGILVFFIGNYLLRIFYSFDVPEFLKETWLEGLLMLLLVYDGISNILFGVPLLHYILNQFGIGNVRPYYLFFLQVYVIIIAGMELVKSNKALSQINIKPAVSLILSLLIIISAGTALLMMPEMTVLPGSMPALDALFTAISAISQTGLVVVDTGSYFSFKGQLIILFLIQIGALGIISFGTFFGAYLAKNITIRQQYSFHDFILSDSEVSTTKLFGKIITYTLVIDVIGTFMIYYLLDPSIPFRSTGDKIFFSIFHSISAFCNAGFVLFKQGLYHESLRELYALHLGITFLVFLGSLGYPALIDIMGPRKLLDRFKQPWRSWTIDTRLTVYTSIGLVLLGLVGFWLLEKDNTLSGQSAGQAGITALFQSVTRTSGFNTVDIGTLTMPALIMICFLMFVGGASGSVCGGIRTSTFSVSLLSFWAIIRGRKNVEVWGRRISDDVVYKMIAIIVTFVCFLFVVIFLLTITDPQFETVRLVFEGISALGTVGLSTGITPHMSDAGKTILLVAMFIGRIGTLSLVFALSSQLRQASYKYPDTQIMIG